MDPQAPGRNDEERQALIYRNAQEVSKAKETALRAAVVSAIAENTCVSNFRQLSFSLKANYTTLESLQPQLSRSRKKTEHVSRGSIPRNGGTCWRTAPRGRRWRRQTKHGQWSSEPGEVG